MTSAFSFGYNSASLEFSYLFSDCTYLAKPSAISNIQHKVNFWAEYNYFEFRIFILLNLLLCWG